MPDVNINTNANRGHSERISCKLYINRLNRFQHEQICVTQIALLNAINTNKISYFLSSCRMAVNKFRSVFLFCFRFARYSAEHYRHRADTTKKRRFMWLWCEKIMKITRNYQLWSKIYRTLFMYGHSQCATPNNSHSYSCIQKHLKW